MTAVRTSLQRTGKTDTVLYFYEGAFTLWRRRMMGICEAARRRGWQVRSVNVDLVTVRVQSAIGFWKPVGVIVDGGVLAHRGFGKEAFAGMPTVYCDADDAEFAGPHYEVRHDSLATARAGAGELARLGCESYAYVHYHAPREWSGERCREMERVAKEADAPFAAFDSERACRGVDVAEFLSRLSDFLKRLERPCGVLAANDEMAAHVLAAASIAGISVPDELAVVGIDNDDLTCENTHPTLTSVAPDFERSGRMAAALLARCIAEGGRRPVVESYGASQLVRRQSTRIDSSKDPRVARAIEFIRRNACSKATVAGTIALMGMKARSAESLFKAVCGHSIRDEVMSARLDRAKRLLCDTNLPVAIVCDRCGYTDERSLRYMFAKATGMSPTGWRAANRA